MSDDASSVTVPASTDTANTPLAPATKSRGYFNQVQLREIDRAETVLHFARTAPYTAALATRALDAAWLERFGASLAEARERTRRTGVSRDESRAATVDAVSSGRHLTRLLQAIQSAAKQKNRMLAEDSDPTVPFPLGSYLIGRRLDDTRAQLLQHAELLIMKAAGDALPGYTTEAELAPVRAALARYRVAESGQGTADEAAGSDRVARDRLVHTIQVRRQAVQHAIDGLYPYYETAHGPVRRLFKLPLGRPLIL